MSYFDQILIVYPAGHKAVMLKS